MQVHDEITHMRVVDSGLRLCSPGYLRCLIIGVNTDNIEVIEVAEIDARHRRQFATENEVKQLFVTSFFGHDGSAPSGLEAVSKGRWEPADETPLEEF